MQCKSDKTIDDSEKTIADNAVFKEMVATEKSYNEALKLLEIALIIEVNVKQNPILGKIAPHISILKSISDKLLTHVNKALDPKTTEEEHRGLRTQRLQLFKAFFNAYKPYAELYNKYLEAVKLNPASFSIIDKYLKMNSKSLDLSAHLIQTVQRGPRYAMLIMAAKKNNDCFTENNLKEFNELEEFISGNLVDTNKGMKPAEETYWFGKITYDFVTKLTAASPPPSKKEEPKASYSFRTSPPIHTMFLTTKPSAAEAVPLAPTEPTKVTASEDTDDFVLIVGDEQKDEVSSDNSNTP